MKLLKKVVPHLAVSFSLATLVIAILNIFNPRMGFLSSKQAVVLIILTALLALLSSVLYISEQLVYSSGDRDTKK